MTAAYEDVDLIPATDDLVPDDGPEGPAGPPPDFAEAEDALGKLRGARAHLRPVADAEASQVERKPGERPSVELVATKNGVKAEPTNVRWLRMELGAGALGWAFLRSGKPVRVTCIGGDGYRPAAHDGDDNGPATVVALTPKTLSTKLADSHYVFVTRKSKEGDYETEEWYPEADCERALGQPDALPFLRSLRGVTHTPLPRAEGGLISEPGYDDASGLLYHPLGPMPDVPARPTSAQLEAATSRVRALVAEFAWTGKHDLANYLGALLTPLLRLVTPPPYKMIAIVAHQRGSGKSLLAELLRTVHGGTLRSWPSSEEEVGKQITAVLTQTTAPVAQIDNIRGIVRSAKLEALLTTREWTDRMLGTTNDTTVENDRLWVATGNNLTLGGDMDRRVVTISIDPGVERPEDRTDFTIRDLSGHVREHRTEILGDLLTMIAGWDAAGRPMGEPTADSFGKWVAALRGILELCGVEGTFDHADSRSENVDPDAEDAATFLEAIERAFGSDSWTVKDVIHAMRDPQSPGFGSDGSKVAVREGLGLTEAFPTAARGKHWRPGLPFTELSKPLGYWLRNREGQWFEGRRVEKAGRRRNGAEYRVEGIAKAAQKPGEQPW